MNNGRLSALIGMLRPEFRIALSPATIWRAMQVYNTIKIWKSKHEVKSLIMYNYLVLLS